jgi:hypothetical protein
MCIKQARTHIHGSSGTHDPILSRTSKLTTILVESVNKIRGLLQYMVVLMRESITNLQPQKKFN